MYTKEWDSTYGAKGGWQIFDPQGDLVCYITNTFGADALLTHLNRSYNV